MSVGDTAEILEMRWFPLTCPSTIVHVCPFQCSNSGCRLTPPTMYEPAAQTLALVKATMPEKLACWPLSGGVGTTDQACPFQCSTSVCDPPPESATLPAAHTSLLAVADTFSS